MSEKRHFRNKVAACSSRTSTSTTANTNALAAQAPQPQQPQQQWDSETCTAVARQLMKKCLDHYEGEGVSSPKKSSRKAPKASLGTLYHGALSARVYLRLRMAQHLKAVQHVANTKPAAKKTRSSTRQPHDNEIQSLLQDAMRIAEEAVEIERDRLERHKIRVTLVEGPFVGAKCMLTALYHHMGYEGRSKEEAEELLEFLQEHSAAMGASECEVLYGRAGALQAIFFLRQELGNDEFGSEEVVVIAQSIVNTGLQTAKTSNVSQGTKPLPLLWEWHEKRYLGAAHGVVGILHTLLCLKNSEIDQIKIPQEGLTLMSLIKDSIQTLQLETYCWPESGNLRSSIGSSASEDKLVHWCHGAPGHVLLLVKAYEVFQDVSYLQKAREIGEKVIWPRGLLRKGVGLCHGISGNAYCLLALGRPNRSDNDHDDREDKKSEASGNEQQQQQQQSDPMFYMKQACYFAAFSLEKWSLLESIPDHPYSVFEGAGGLALLMMDLGTINHKNNHGIGDESLRDARFPLYDF